MNIGLIGGIGPAATEHYYRHLVRLAAADDRELDLTIVQASARTLRDNVLRGAIQEQADAFLPYVNRLRDAGADAAAVTSVGGHCCIEQLKAVSPLPMIDLIPALDTHLVQSGLQRVGLLGTGLAMDTRIYGGIPSVEAVVPPGDTFSSVSRDYMAIAGSARCDTSQRSRFFDAGAALCREQGAEAIVLAGTDLFLAFQDRDPGYPVIDAARVHVEAIYHASLE